MFKNNYKEELRQAKINTVNKVQINNTKLNLDKEALAGVAVSISLIGLAGGKRRKHE